MKRLTAALGLILLVGGSSPGVLAAELGGFFSCADIVFFGPCLKTAPSAPAKPPGREGAGNTEPAPTAGPEAPSAKRPRVEESVWAEPVRGPDGQLRVYLPPKPVRDFLEKPTPENARAYLEWNQARMRQMDEAVSVMRDVAAQGFGITAEEPAIVSALPSALGAPARRETAQLLPPTPPPAPKTIEVPAPAPGETATGPISIVYAFATWCPYSRRQTPIINQLAAHVPVRGIAFDSTPEEVQALRPALTFPVMHGDVDLRERLGVRSYPTIFFYEGSRLLHVARGLQSPDRLVTALAALTSRQSPPALGAGREPGGDTCRLRT